MRPALIIIFFLVAVSGFSQTREKPLIQFSGVIYNEENNSTIPDVTIVNRSNRNSTFVGKYNGYFSFVVREGDTIIFKSIGYRSEAVIIPSNLSDKKYTFYVKMKPEAINLPLITILPWANIDDFTRDFLTMKFADDDLEIAKKNLSRDNMVALAKTLPRDAGEMQSYSFQSNHINMTNKNMNMKGANPLLNPFAWGALMQQILNGDKSNSD